MVFLWSICNHSHFTLVKNSLSFLYLGTLPFFIPNFHFDFLSIYYLNWFGKLFYVGAQCFLRLFTSMSSEEKQENDTMRYQLSCWPCMCMRLFVKSVRLQPYTTVYVFGEFATVIAHQHERHIFCVFSLGCFTHLHLYGVILAFGEMSKISYQTPQLNFSQSRKSQANSDTPLHT